MAVTWERRMDPSAILLGVAGTLVTLFLGLLGWRQNKDAKFTDTLAKEVDSLRGEVKDLRGRLSAVEDELQDTRGEVLALTAERDALKLDNTRLTTTNVEQGAHILRLEAMINEKQDAIERLEHSLRQLKGN